MATYYGLREPVFVMQCSEFYFIFSCFIAPYIRMYVVVLVSECDGDGVKVDGDLGYSSALDSAFYIYGILCSSDLTLAVFLYFKLEKIYVGL